MIRLPRPSRSATAAALFLLLLALALFRAVLPPGITLLAQDHNPALLAQYQSELPRGMFTGFWRASPFLGRMGVHPMTSLNLLLSVLPRETASDFIYPACLLAGSLFLLAFLRLRGIPTLPALAGTLTAFWTGSNLTLAAPGHLEKFAVLCFAAATLFGIESLFQTRRTRWALFTGGCLGMMAMHQGDVALFFALPLAAWFTFRLLTVLRTEPATLTPRQLLLLPALALPLLLMGTEAVRFANQAHVRDAAILQNASPEDQWNFATQWSWPPQEALDLIAPGYHGWATGHPARPYTGITGRSPKGTPETQTLLNFKLESTYLGLLPLALALFALFASPRDPERRFWALLTLLALLLAAGKFTPLYRLFHALPLVNSIRNPNKFLQVFQLLLGILTACGAHELLTASPRLRRHFARSLLAAGALLTLAALLTHPADPLQLRPLQNTPWQDQAPAILAGRQTALLHAGLLTALAASLCLALSPRRLLPALLALLCADTLLASRPYIESLPLAPIQTNPVAAHLKSTLGPHRVATLETDGLYSQYLNLILPWHQIPHANLLVAPRLDTPTQTYLNALGNDHLRMWRDLGVTTVLLSQPLWQQLQQLPDYASALQPILTYNYDTETHLVLRLRDAPGRFHLTNGTLHTVTPEPAAFTLTLTVQEPGGTLRLADRYNPRLTARLNDTPHPVRTEQNLFPVLDLPPGTHTLTLRLDPHSPTRLAQQTGVILWLLLCLALPFLKPPAINTAATP